MMFRPVLFIALLFFSTFFWMNAWAQQADQDQDGLPDRQESESCLESIERYFPKGKKVYLSLKKSRHQGSIVNFVVSNEYDLIYRSEAPEDNRFLIDVRNEIRKKNFLIQKLENDQDRLRSEIKKSEGKSEKVTLKSLEDILRKGIKGDSTQQGQETKKQSLLVLEQRIKKERESLDSLQLHYDMLEEKKESSKKERVKTVKAYQLSLKEAGKKRTTRLVITKSDMKSFLNEEGCLKDQDGDQLADIYDPCPRLFGEKGGCPDQDSLTLVQKNREADSLDLLASEDKRIPSVKDAEMEEKIIRDSILLFNDFLDRIQGNIALDSKQSDTLRAFANYFANKTEKFMELQPELARESRLARNAARSTLNRFKNQFYIFIASLLLIVAFNIFYLSRIRKKNQELRQQKDELFLSNQELDQKQEEIHLNLQEINQKKQIIELLLRELNHRVKNNLVVIASMLYNRMNTGRPEDLKDQVMGVIKHIEEIEKLHKKLTYNENKKKEIPLRNYFEEIISSLSELYEYEFDVLPSIHIEGDSTEVKEGYAYFLGFIVYELVTNSFKYAFDEIPSPKIELKYYLDEEGSLSLDYRDNGSGIAAEYFEAGIFQLEKINSQGLKIINLISQMHQGTFLVAPASVEGTSPPGAVFHCRLRLV